MSDHPDPYESTEAPTATPCYLCGDLRAIAVHYKASEQFGTTLYVGHRPRSRSHPTFPCPACSAAADPGEPSSATWPTPKMLCAAVQAVHELHGGSFGDAYSCPTCWFGARAALPCPTVAEYVAGLRRTIAADRRQSELWRQAVAQRDDRLADLHQERAGLCAEVHRLTELRDCLRIDAGLAEDATDRELPAAVQALRRAASSAPAETNRLAVSPASAVDADARELDRIGAALSGSTTPKTEHGSDPQRPDTKLSVDEIVRKWRPGSGAWSWPQELADILRHASEQLASLVLDVAEHGVRDPILLGDDGRVWDGHHRLLVARLLGIGTVPVQYGTGGTRNPEPRGDHDG